jgi:hypothetical protein
MLSLLRHSDLDVFVALDRAGSFLLKFDALEACLRATDAPTLLLLDADAVLVAPTTATQVETALAGRGLAMVEQTGIRGSGMGRADFLDHYARHSLAFLAPSAPSPEAESFRFFNSGVVIGTRQELRALATWARTAIEASGREHRVGEHMIADQDYYQVWVNHVHRGSCTELDWSWNHCEHWHEDFPRPGARILHFSGFCRGPTRETVARMRAARRGRMRAGFPLGTGRLGRLGARWTT